MNLKTNLLTVLLNKSGNLSAESINDLRDKEFSGLRLSPDERFALSNYDRYRIEVLNGSSKEKFNLHYRQLQVIANLSDWREFLKKEFDRR